MTNRSVGGRGGDGFTGDGRFNGLNGGRGGNGGSGSGGAAANSNAGAFNELKIANSTLTANSTSGGNGGNGGNGAPGPGNSSFGGTGGGGGVGKGGGAYNAGNRLTLLNATLSADTATGGAGGALGTGNINGGPGSPGTGQGGGANNSGTTVRAANAIIANNSSGGNCAGTITDSGHNLKGSPTNTCGLTVGGATSDVLADPLLGPLTDNGGPTRTMTLGTGSPAIDAGDATVCAGAPVGDRDQRGGIRPVGAACDIGAYEANALALSSLSPTSGASTGGSTVTIRGVGFGGTTSVTFGIVAATVTNVTPTAITLTAPAHDPGTVDVVVTSGGQSATLTAAYTYGVVAPLPPPKPSPPPSGPPGPSPLPNMRPSGGLAPGGGTPNPLPPRAETRLLRGYRAHVRLPFRFREGAGG